MTPPIEPLAVAEHIAARLGGIAGVVAVALGGSRARGAAGADSDVDLGIYYRSSSPPPVDRFRRLAHELHTGEFRAEVTELGQWGPWVNGGAWLEVQGLKVDWLYRDLERVSIVIEDCARGVVTSDCSLGHPHGFHNHIYLAEVHYGRPLIDPAGVLDRLKQRVRVYPAALKTGLVARFLYEADFMLELARTPASRGDVFHVSGCLFRCAAALVQVLFAVNETYFMNEKGAVGATEAFAIQPAGFSARVTAILAGPGRPPDALRASLADMATLVVETRALALGGG